MDRSSKSSGSGGAEAATYIHKKSVTNAARDKAKESKEQQLEVVIPALSIQTLKLKVVGDSTLVFHAWSQKARGQIRDTGGGAPKEKKGPRTPWLDFIESMYWITPKPNPPKSATERDVAAAKFGLPTLAFKSAAVDACSHVDKSLTKVIARGAFHLNGELVEIVGPPPRMREDMVRVGMTTDIRYRGEMPEWSATLEIRFNDKVLSARQIVHLFNVAGFAIGVGEGRPQKDRSWGMFHVALT